MLRSASSSKFPEIIRSHLFLTVTFDVLVGFSSKTIRLIILYSELVAQDSKGIVNSMKVIDYLLKHCTLL